MEMTKTILMELLNEKIKEICCPNKWVNYLQVLSRFPQYGYENAMMIYWQRPDATLVHTLSDWKKQNGQIKQDAKDIKIFSTQIVKKKNKEAGKEIPDLKVSVTSLYDVNDVKIDNHDNTPKSPLEGSVCHHDLTKVLIALIDISQCSIYFTNDKKITGFYNAEHDEIILNAGMPRPQTIKMLIHLLSHSLLHYEDGIARTESKISREIEAESIAYIVCNRLNIGLERDDYLFSKIKGWEQLDLDSVKESLQAISVTADYLLGILDSNIKEPAETTLPQSETTT